jgi:hypothetical protein
VTDPLKKLENDLAALRPAALSSDVTRNIAARLAADEPQRWTFADRCLAAAMTAGSLAACIIVALLTWQSLGSSPAVPTLQPQLATYPPTPTLGEYQQALARADDPAADIIK